MLKNLLMLGGAVRAFSNYASRRSDCVAVSSDVEVNAILEHFRAVALDAGVSTGGVWFQDYLVSRDTYNMGVKISVTYHPCGARVIGCNDHDMVRLIGWSFGNLHSVDDDQVVS